MRPSEWFCEWPTPATAHLFRLRQMVATARTPYQQAQIVDTDAYGRMLVIDGQIQSAAADEYIYHEALVHPTMLLHPAPRRILVAGGGEGAVLREIFRHPAVEQAVMVDIDREVVALCRAHLSDWHQGSFDDPRLELVIADARGYLAETPRRFDVMIMDLCDPCEGGPARNLFTRQFYEIVRARLAPGGLAVLQAGDVGVSMSESHAVIFNTVGQVFAQPRSYRAFIPSYCTEWGFVMAARDAALGACPPDLISRRIAERRLHLRFYDAETHAAMFALSKDFRCRRARASRVLLDDSAP